MMFQSFKLSEYGGIDDCQYLYEISLANQFYPVDIILFYALLV